jgi:RNA polymerase sigma-70 factor (ECF subfamily)
LFSFLPGRHRRLTRVSYAPGMSEEELVRRYGRVVYGYSLSLTREPAEAEDLAQETLLKALRGWRSFEGRSTVASWLYRIAANSWKNRLRARSSRKTLRFLSLDGEVLSEPENAASALSSPESEAESWERSRLVAEALARLPKEERIVLELRELEGLSYEEIAEVQGLPLGTVKSRLSRARSTLARLLLALAMVLGMVVVSGMLMKRYMPGLMGQIQGMIQGAAGSMGSGH